jgi:hypothetical protein
MRDLVGVARTEGRAMIETQSTQTPSIPRTQIEAPFDAERVIVEKWLDGVDAYAKARTRADGEPLIWDEVIAGEMRRLQVENRKINRELRDATRRVEILEHCWQQALRVEERLGRERAARAMMREHAEQIVAELREHGDADKVGRASRGRIMQLLDKIIDCVALP